MSILSAGASQSFTSAGNLTVQVSMQGGSSGYFTLDGVRTDLTVGTRHIRAAAGSVVVLVCYTGILTYTQSDVGGSPAAATSTRVLFTSRALTTDDSGLVLEVAAGATVTVPPSLGQNFSCAMDVVGGTLNIARSGAATLNGAATTLTRAARQLISISQCLTGSPNDYTVTGV